MPKLLRFCYWANRHNNTKKHPSFSQAQLNWMPLGKRGGKYYRLSVLAGCSALGKWGAKRLRTRSEKLATFKEGRGIDRISFPFPDRLASSAASEICCKSEVVSLPFIWLSPHGEWSSLDARLMIFHNTITPSSRHVKQYFFLWPKPMGERLKKRLARPMPLFCYDTHNLLNSQYFRSLFAVAFLQSHYKSMPLLVRIGKKCRIL